MFKRLNSIPNYALKMFISLSLAINIFAIYSVQAHETAANESVPFERIYAAILDKAANLDFEELPENSHNYEAYLRGSKKYVIVGPRQYVKVDNAFEGLVENIGRLYLAEFEQDCEECVLPSLESLTNEALSKVAKGWFSENVRKAKELLAYRYAGAFVTLGGRYGPAAGVIKLVGELMEEMMLILFKLPGAHIFCEVITAAIAIYAGKTNTVLRSFGLSQYSNMSFLSQPRAVARLTATSFVMRRALKRMAIGVQSFDINQEELEHFVKEEKEDKLWYRFKNFLGRTNQNHRVVHFLSSLQQKTEAENARVSIRSRNKTIGEITDLSRNEETVNEMYLKDMKLKVYQGSRYGWMFFLKRRKQKDSLSQFADNSASVTNSRAFWLVGLKNDILDPLTNSKAVQADYDSQARMSFRLELDTITEKQINEYSKTNPDGAEGIFKSLDAITDYGSLSMGERRIQLAFFQSFVAEVMPRLMNKMVESVFHQYSEDEKKLMRVYSLYYRVGEITFYAEQLVDFLRFAAVAKSSSDPFLKYHIRDYYLKINEAMSLVASFESSRSLDDLMKLLNTLKTKTNDLKANRFWIEKKNEIGFLPSSLTNVTNYVFHPFSHPSQKVKDRLHYFEDLYDFGTDGFKSKERYKRPRYKSGAPACESLYL